MAIVAKKKLRKISFFARKQVPKNHFFLDL